MEVILLSDISGLGKVREIKKVKSGYANNYLIKNGLAVKATKANMKKLEEEIAYEEANREQLKAEAEKNAASLEKVTISVKTKVGPDGKLYGAVTAKDISKAIKEATGLDIDKRKIVMDNIKQSGEHILPVKLFSEVEGKIKVNVESEE